MNRDNQREKAANEDLGYDVIRTGLLFHAKEETRGEEPEKKAGEAGAEDKYNSLSATNLQKLIKCPLQFYYKTVENIGEIEGKHYGVWLSASEKGSFFHKIMELYFEEVLGSDASIIAHQQSLHEEVFERAYQVALKEMEIKVPYPSDEAKDKEASDIKEVALRFIRDMHDYYEREAEEARAWRVIGNELAFGPEKDLRVPYSLGEGYSIEWNGSIDRMDGYLDEEGIFHLKIVDYKTNEYKKLNNNIKNNTELQHFIYGAVGLEYVRSRREALEEALGSVQIRGLMIDDVIYSLPFEEEKKKNISMGEIVSACIRITGLDYELHLPEEILTIVRTMLISAKKGDKTSLLKAAADYIEGKTEKERDDSCKYCNYKELCRRHIG